MRRLNRPLSAFVGVFIFSLFLSACGGSGAKSDLTGAKNYLTEKTKALKTASGNLKTASDQYYALAQGASFNYANLWKDKPADVTKAIQAAGVQGQVGKAAKSGKGTKAKKT